MPGKLLLTLLATLGLSACSGLTYNQCPEFPDPPEALMASPPTLWLSLPNAPRPPGN